ncbi:MAG: acetoin utilization AcuB family protein [Vulcanibacillus sp.]
MLVEEIMTTKVVTLKKYDTIQKAYDILTENHFHHIPIVDEENHVIGIISDRDLRDAFPSIFEKVWSKDILDKPLEQIMKTNVRTIHPLEFVEEVSSIFYENELSCLPVTREGLLVGIITDRDMLNTLIQLTGALQPSSQIEVKVKNTPGTLAQVVLIIAKENVQINSVLVYPYAKNANYKIIVLRIQTMNPIVIVNNLKEQGHEVLWPNLPGVKFHEK